MKKDSFWFPFEPNRWLANEKLGMVSLEARGLWIHLVCLMYKANSEGKLLIGGNIPTIEQISRSVGEDCSVPFNELKIARVFDYKDGAIFHQGIADGLKKINLKIDGYRRRDGAKMNHLLPKDESSLVKRYGENKNKSKNKIVRENGAQMRPALSDWLAYAKTIGWTGIDVQGAFDHYESNGWRVGGRSPVKNWQAAARNCFRRSHGTQSKGTPMQTKPQQRSSCESAPLYRVMGFSSYADWAKAGSPS